MWPNASVGIQRPDAAQGTASDSEGFDADQCSALHAASHLWVDDVILPQDTRRVLIQCLQCLPIGGKKDDVGVPCSLVRM